MSTFFYTTANTILNLVNIAFSFNEYCSQSFEQKYKHAEFVYCVKKLALMNKIKRTPSYTGSRARLAWRIVDICPRPYKDFGCPNALVFAEKINEGRINWNS